MPDQLIATLILGHFLPFLLSPDDPEYQDFEKK